LSVKKNVNELKHILHNQFHLVCLNRFFIATVSPPEQLAAPDEMLNLAAKSDAKQRSALV